MTILLIHPGADHSTADVEAGLRAGLERAGVRVIQYRLDGRLDAAKAVLQTAWKRARKAQPTLEQPTWADVVYQAGIGALERALRFQVDAVVVVSGILLHPDVVILLRRAGLPVAVALTESPYDAEPELALARLADHVWTNERTSVAAYASACGSASYLPAAWAPDRHGTPTDPDLSLPAHDVVFVGSGFPARIAFLEAIDWTGIDLGLYGTWQTVGRRSPLKKFIRGGVTPNATAVSLYRNATLGLNLYRGSVCVDGQMIVAAPGESLNPRAYELAACGVFTLSASRAESGEVLGDLVPQFHTPAEAERLIRFWLGADQAADRARIAAALPAFVAGHSWSDRALTVIADLHSLLMRRRAA